MKDFTPQLLKAQSLKIFIKPNKIKNKPVHYTLVFQQIPYYTKDHRLLYSELIFHDCTFDISSIPILLITNPSTIKINNSTYLINNLQSVISKTPLTFQYHEEPSTTQLITFAFPEGD